MRLSIIGIGVGILFFMAIIANAATDTNFSASSLLAKDIDCKKCHVDTPHIIHAKRTVDCVACHGPKTDVTIPLCIKCHDGSIHQTHAKKVSTVACDYCHKNLANVHINLINETVCSHCHRDLIEVHDGEGGKGGCAKCHKTAPDIVKPLKSPEMIIICEDCHKASSVATIHGLANETKGCYMCHKGTANITGSDIPHNLHAGKVTCEDCHEEKGSVIIPKCMKCHKIDDLHSFNLISKLTIQTGLNCEACHAEAR